MAETKSFTTSFDDANKANGELEAHRAKAIDHFGGHVHIVNTHTSSVPMHDEAGMHTGHTFVMTSVWKAAPPEPVLAPAIAEGKAGSLGTE